MKTKICEPWKQFEFTISLMLQQPTHPINGGTKQVLGNTLVGAKPRRNDATYVILPEPACAILSNVEVGRKTNHHPCVDVTVSAASEVTDCSCRTYEGTAR